MSLGRGPKPWIIDDPVAVSPTEFEELVCSWLAGGAQGLADFRVDHLRKIPGDAGEYAIDAVAEFTIFGGASMLVLVECKHQKRPVEREQVMVLEAKLLDTGAQKGMIFSTSGYQKGALEYAAACHIATITVQDGNALYETKAFGSVPATPPPWVEVYRFVGVKVCPVETGVRFHRIDGGYHDAIKDWLTECFGEFEGGTEGASV